MTHFLRLFSVLAFCGFAALAHAHQETAGQLQITHPWAKASLEGVPNGVVYMAITNTGDTDDALVAASSEVAGAAELHTMTMKDGVMRMRPLEQGVPLPAGETVVLEPGGKHVMLIGLKRQLKGGESFGLTLTFENAGEHRVEVRVLEERQEDSDS